MALCQKASDYYHYPLGEVVLKTLPKMIRLGKAVNIAPPEFFQISEEGLKVDEVSLARSKKQNRLTSRVSNKPPKID